MNMNQLAKKMIKNAETFATAGELEKSFACIAIAEKIKSEQYDTIKGHMDLSKKE